MRSVPVMWKVRATLDEHGISPYRFMKESGLSQGTVYRLVNGTTCTINTDTLDRVVTTLRRLTGKHLELQDLLEFLEP